MSVGVAEDFQGDQACNGLVMLFRKSGIPKSVLEEFLSEEGVLRIQLIVFLLRDGKFMSSLCRGEGKRPKNIARPCETV